MPLDEDKYPTETGRRRFVKGVVGSAALASVATGSAAALNSATSPTGIGGGQVQYMGIENTDGPAPRGMPIVPITINNAGELRGVFPEAETQEVAGQEVQVAEMQLGGIRYSSEWFQYCGVQQYEGAQPAADQDNFFRAPASSSYDWMGDLDTGTILTRDMFDDYESWTNITDKTLGKPAEGTWRSQGDGAKTMPIQVLRSPEIPKMIDGEVGFRDYGTLPSSVRNFIEAASQDNFIAWLNKCTHFCCVPGFKSLSGSTAFDGGDQVYCQCHQSLYDPFSPVQKQFTALPRPEE
jgi:Rieske Fe-S protein